MARLTGAVTNRPHLADRRQQRPYEQGSRATFFLGEVDAVAGAAELDITLGATTSGKVALPARTSLAITLGARTAWTVTPSTSSPHTGLPEVVFEIGFDDQPLTFAPAWTDVSSRLRGVGGITTKRGRSYEFDRMETGTLQGVLSNRDAALSPENTASPYAPVRSTRPLRASFVWGSNYPAFRGISEGYPQSYTNLGLDAVVEVQANDLFYALNNSRFTPGSTTLGEALAVVDTDGEMVVSVGQTALPMPQAVPFEITFSGTETATVTEIVNDTEYRVTRTAANSAAHLVGATVTTQAVSFGQAYSGERIREVLEAVFGPVNVGGWYDLDAGQSLIAPSENLATTSPLEHINLVTEAEFGRFFVSRAGKFTFRDRSSIIVDYLTPVFTFRALEQTTGTEVPFRLEQPLEHSEEKLFNRVKITIPSGYAVDIKDQPSIDEHFERVFEKQYPYANPNDADSAAHFVLSRNSADTLRLPEIIVQGAKDAERLWPLLLEREIGDRVTFRYLPAGGGDEIVKDMAIEAISHRRSAADHQVAFQCTEVDSTQYWILGLTDYSELDTKTRVAF